MGRIKTERFELRMTPKEKANLQEKAEKARMSMTEYILALSERKKIYVVEDFPKINYHILKIGININQITRRVNQGDPVTNEHLEIIENKQTEIINLIDKLLKVCMYSKDEVIKL